HVGLPKASNHWRFFSMALRNAAAHLFHEIDCSANWDEPTAVRTPELIKAAARDIFYRENSRRFLLAFLTRLHQTHPRYLDRQDKWSVFNIREALRSEGGRLCNGPTHCD